MWLLAVFADVPPAPGASVVWTAWQFEPAVIAALLAAGVLYVYGLNRIWRETGIDHGVRIWQAQAFLGGLAALVGALLSPLDGLSLVLFSAHMLQHLLLMLVAAPLLVLGAPLLAYQSALPGSVRERVCRLSRRGRLAAVFSVIVRLDVAWFLSVVALWVWHLPALYQAALTNHAVHAAEHCCLLGTAIVFWQIVLTRLQRRQQCGAVVLALLAMAVQSTILGVALTFSPTPWYPSYAVSAPNWGLTGLIDQQLAGLIMWIPAAAVYLGGALFTLGLLMSDAPTPAADPFPDNVYPERAAAGALGQKSR